VELNASAWRPRQSAAHAFELLDKVTDSRKLMQDEHGITLLSYAAGVGYPRVNKLLQLLLDGHASGSLALIACARSAPLAPAAPPARQPGAQAGSQLQPGLQRTAVVVPVAEAWEPWARLHQRRSAAARRGAHDASGLMAPARQGGQQSGPYPRRRLWSRVRVHPGLHIAASAAKAHATSVLDLLRAQRAACSTIAWDWATTAGLSEEHVVWNCLELALLADYPSRTQARFRCCAASAARAPPGATADGLRRCL
jgi:hypothetical protein